MSVDPTEVADEAVREARDLLLGRVQIARERIVRHLEGGVRNHVELRVLVETYIGLLTACDVLGGYCHVKPVKA